MNPRDRNAFTLPVVLLVALAGTVLIGSTIERHAVSRLAAFRQVNAYDLYHTEKSVESFITAWWELLRDATPDQMEELGDLTGTLRVPGGVDLALRMRPAQGGLPTGSAAAGDDLLERAARNLRQNLGPRARELLRDAGPPEISIHHATADVLSAVATAASGDPTAASRWASEALSQREADELTERADLIAIGREADLEDEAAERLAGYFTFRPVLYEVEVEMLGRASGASDGVIVPSRYMGLVAMESGRKIGTDAASKMLRFRRVAPGELFPRQNRR